MSAEQDKQKLLKSLRVPALLTSLMILAMLIEMTFGISLHFLGVLPRSVEGFPGLLFYPLIHGDAEHLMSNFFPMVFLGASLFYLYPTAAMRVQIILYFVPGVMVWVFARPSYHIGASGIIYGYAAFLFFSGIIRKDRRSMALALTVSFLHGGLVWGLLPVKPGISWEGHLAGMITGIACAFIFRKYDPYRPYAWEDEDDDDDDTTKKKLEISWDNIDY